MLRYFARKDKQFESTKWTCWITSSTHKKIQKRMNGSSTLLFMKVWNKFHQFKAADTLYIVLPREDFSVELVIGMPAPSIDLYTQSNLHWVLLHQLKSFSWHSREVVSLLWFLFIYRPIVINIHVFFLFVCVCVWLCLRWFDSLSLDRITNRSWSFIWIVAFWALLIDVWNIFKQNARIFCTLRAVAK